MYFDSPIELYKNIIIPLNLYFDSCHFDRLVSERQDRNEIRQIYLDKQEKHMNFNKIKSV